MKSSAGLQTQRAPSCEASTRIRWHLNRLEKRGVTSNERLMRWRLIVRAGQEEYDRELAVLDSLQSIKSDPACEVPIA